jgi:hypothetical protein
VYPLLQAAEQAAAKSKYAGKLTMDFLEERVGHRFFEHLRELDLSGFRLRDLGDIFHREVCAVFCRHRFSSKATWFWSLLKPVSIFSLDFTNPLEITTTTFRKAIKHSN